VATATTAVPVPERIAGGVALLDREAKSDWRKHINPKLLALEGFDECPLGQLYGSFRNGVLALGIKRRGITELGFNRRVYANESYEELTMTWRSYLEACTQAPAN